MNFSFWKLSASLVSMVLDPSNYSTTLIIPLSLSWDFFSLTFKGWYSHSSILSPLFLIPHIVLVWFQQLSWCSLPQWCGEPSLVQTVGTDPAHPLPVEYLQLNIHTDILYCTLHSTWKHWDLFLQFMNYLGQKVFICLYKFLTYHNTIRSHPYLLSRSQTDQLSEWMLHRSTLTQLWVKKHTFPFMIMACALSSYIQIQNGDIRVLFLAS